MGCRDPKASTCPVSSSEGALLFSIHSSSMSVLTLVVRRVDRSYTNMAAGFDATNGVSQGVPQPLFPTQIRGGDNRPYAVDKNGQRFLLKVAPDPQVGSCDQE